MLPVEILRVSRLEESRRFRWRHASHDAHGPRPRLLGGRDLSAPHESRNRLAFSATLALPRDRCPCGSCIRPSRKTRRAPPQPQPAASRPPGRESANQIREFGPGLKVLVDLIRELVAKHKLFALRRASCPPLENAATRDLELPPPPAVAASGSGLLGLSVAGTTRYRSARSRRLTIT